MLTSPLISYEAVAELGDGVVLLDARAGEKGRAAYRESHLAGAHWVDLDSDLADVSDDPSAGGRHPLPAIREWCRRLGDWGIGPETDVVIYDDSAGAMAATRAWWMVKAVGHGRVALLDGGLASAADAGALCDAEEPPLADVHRAYPLPSAKTWVAPLVGIDEVEARRRSAETRLIDVRAAQRYRGEEETFDPIAGHIPGAVNHPYESSIGESGRFQTPEELREAIEGTLGEVDAESAIVYCGSGVTACHLLFAMEVAGLKGAALYTGSWSEWCRSGRPRASVHGSGSG